MCIPLHQWSAQDAEDRFAAMDFACFDRPITGSAESQFGVKIAANHLRKGYAIRLRYAQMLYPTQ